MKDRLLTLGLFSDRARRHSQAEEQSWLIYGGPGNSTTMAPSAGGTYVDFWQITESALEFAAQSLQLRLASSQREALMRGTSS